MKPWAKFHQNPSLSKKISNFPFVCGSRDLGIRPGQAAQTSLSKIISRFSEPDLGVVPQPAHDSYPPLVWPKSCSHKVPKGLSKNICKELKRKMWAKLPSGSTFAGDETH